MRISDWSAYVCSSDLIAAVGVALLLAGCTGSPAPVETADAEPEAPADFCEVLETNGPAYNAVFDKEAVNASDLTVFELWASNLTEPADRKSVVSGKSVSVRVDLGGRQRIKKKNTDIELRREI